jgi:hypothetical protein
VPETVAEPVAVPVNITEQLPANSIQLGVFSVPPVVPAVKVNVTVPVGVFAGVVVSITVAVHVDAWFITTVEGLQETVVRAVVSLLCRVTVIDAEALTGLAL